MERGKISMQSRFDWILFITTLICILIGILNLYFQDWNIDEPSNKWMKQLFFLFIGLIVFLIFYKINYQTLGIYSIHIFLFSIFLLMITLIPFIGSEIKGARSWIRIGPIGYQTSELAIFALIIILAKYLELKQNDIQILNSLFIPFVITLLIMVLIIVQPDLGGAVFLAPLLLTMLFIGGADTLHISSIIIFFTISLSIPIYREYNNIILIQDLSSYLESIDKLDYIPAINILKNQTWKFLFEEYIPKNISGDDLNYLLNILNNKNLFIEFKELALTLRYEQGGLFLKLMDNDLTLLVTSIILILIALILFIIRISQGISYKYLRKYYTPIGVLGISILSAFTIQKTINLKYHQIVRVTAFLNPEKFPRDLAYQIRVSKSAVGSGQFLGKGFTKGELTTGNSPIVPEASTDFVFSSWAERTGFIGSILLLVLLMVIPIRGFYISLYAKDRFGMLLAAGISTSLAYHIILNIGIEIGLLPVTGLPLTFISYGGSHLITNLAMLGTLENIYSKRFAN